MFGWSGTKRRERGGETLRLQCRERVAQRIARTVRTSTRSRFESRSGLSNGKTAHRVASSSSSFVTGGRRGQQQPAHRGWPRGDRNASRRRHGPPAPDAPQAQTRGAQLRWRARHQVRAARGEGASTRGAPNENALRARTSPSARRDFKFRLRSGDSPRARARHARPHARRPNRHVHRDSLRAADPTPSLTKSRP